MKSSGLIVFASALALATAGTAHATAVYVASGSDADGALKGEADITVTGDQVVITLKNLLTDVKNAGEEVSGIELIMSGPAKSVALSSDSGNVIDINGKGTTGYSTVGDTVTHWGVAETGSDIYLATAGTGAQGGTPEDLIIDPQTNYLDANSSITKNHQDAIEGPGTFDLTLTPETPTSPAPTIFGVKIEFGTNPDDTITAGCGSLCNLGEQVNNAVPEPETWALMIVGFMGVGGLIRADRRRRAAALLAE